MLNIIPSDGSSNVLRYYRKAVLQDLEQTRAEGDSSSMIFLICLQNVQITLENQLI